MRDEFAVTPAAATLRKSLWEAGSVRYLIAILLPPLGMLLAHRPGQAVVCLLLQLTIIGWPLAAIWAVLVVNNYYADRRTERLIRAQRRRR